MRDATSFFTPVCSRPKVASTGPLTILPWAPLFLNMTMKCHRLPQGKVPDMTEGMHSPVWKLQARPLCGLRGSRSALASGDGLPLQSPKATGHKAGSHGSQHHPPTPRGDEASLAWEKKVHARLQGLGSCSGSVQRPVWFWNFFWWIFSWNIFLFVLGLIL